MNDSGTPVDELTEDDVVGSLVESLTMFIELSRAGVTLDDIETIPCSIMLVQGMADEVNWIYPLADLRREFEKLEIYFELQDEPEAAVSTLDDLEGALREKSWQKVTIQEQLDTVVEKSGAFLHLCRHEKTAQWTRVQQKRIMSLFGIAHRNTVASWAESKSFIRKEGRGEYYMDLGHPEVQQALRTRKKKMRS